MNLQKKELERRINDEHGINYHKNINLSGYTVYRQSSFITFHFVEINNVNTVVVDYVYVTNKTSFIKLFSWCINFFAGNNVKFIYLKEHKRQSNVVKKYLETVGFTVTESKNSHAWQHAWTSTNGFNEDEIIEAYI